MEVTGKIKKIDETKVYGESFRKREMVLTTNDQYPQMLKIEFVQDKCDLLDKYKVDADVKISINLTGREWINPQGEAVYFNAIQGWRVEKLDEVHNAEVQNSTPQPLGDEDDSNPLPF